MGESQKCEIETGNPHPINALRCSRLLAWVKRRKLSGVVIGHNELIEQMKKNGCHVGNYPEQHECQCEDASKGKRAQYEESLDGDLSNFIDFAL